MKNKNKKRAITYYIALNKANNSVILAITKTDVARFLDISAKTVTRKIDNCALYDDKHCTIWKDISAVKVRRGFAL